MERENGTLVWDNHLPNLHFGVPAVNFPGCNSNFQLFDEILLLDPNFLLNRRAPSAQKVAGRFLNLENTKNHAKVRISLPSPSKCHLSCHPKGGPLPVVLRGYEDLSPSLYLDDFPK